MNYYVDALTFILPTVLVWGIITYLLGQIKPLRKAVIKWIEK